MHALLRSTLAAISIGASLALGAGGAAANGTLLSDAQLQKLRGVPVPAMAPQYVPPGYRLSRFEAVKDTVRNGMHSAPANGFVLTYAGPQGRAFTIDVADGAHGDQGPDPTAFRRAYRVDSPVVGSTKMQPMRTDDGRSYFISDYVSLKRLGNTKAILLFSGTNMPRAEMQKIYQSLRLIDR
jgi:hypothetical protein